MDLAGTGRDRGEDPASLSGQGRHIYDIYRLLHTGTVRGAIPKPGIVATLAADAEARSLRHGFASTPRPETGFADSPAWAFAGPVRAVIQDVYSAAAGLIWGPVPTLDECIAEVAAMRDHP